MENRAQLSPFEYHANVALHPDAVDALAAGLARGLGAGGAHALLNVLDGAGVGEQQVLNAGADRAGCDEGARLLGHLHHCHHKH